MAKDRKPLGILAMLAVSAILVSAVIAVNADAARGAGRGGRGSTATMTVSPNPIPLGSTSVVISGSGFAPNQGLQIYTGFVPSGWVTTNGDGSFSITYSHTFNMPDSASMQAWSTSKSPQLLATAYYTVQ